MRTMQRKVPEVILLFWVIKLLTTGMGETFSDFLVHTFDPYLAVAIGAIGFTIALLLQFSVKKYVTWIYWLAVTMVGIPYILSSIFFAIALVVIFITWYKTEKTLSIHSITTWRRELFYWATVVTTFALGTAVGDMTAVTLNLGYMSSGILFIVIFLIPAIGYKFFNIDEVFAFWFAYIITRPLGASFADWIGRSKELGGLGFGTGEISLVLTIFIVVLVGYLSVTHKDVKKVHTS
jgi:uncharacterized membrane-anchored protein